MLQNLRSQFINQKLQANERIKDFYENLSDDFEKNKFEGNAGAIKCCWI